MRWFGILVACVALAAGISVWIRARGFEPVFTAQGTAPDAGDSIIMPQLDTVSAAGTGVSATAQRGTHQGATLELTAPQISWRGPVWWRATATAARIGPIWIEMDGDAHLHNSQGYELASGFLRANTQTDEITSPGPVTIDAPFGQISAGSMQVSHASTPDQMQIHFRNGVRLIYTPQTNRE